MGISSYTIRISNGGSIIEKYIYNIPYIDPNIYDFIKNINPNIHIDLQLPCSEQQQSIYTNIKKQIVDMLNDDETYQRLSKLNIIDEIQELKTENEKLRGERFYQSSELSSMRRSIQRMQEDMKQLLATTSKIQEENTQLTKLLQEKEKTKQFTTIQESQCLSFTHANTIGQALMGNDIFNCM
jgi:predicted nuclease with TOPRIM domain